MNNLIKEQPMMRYTGTLRPVKGQETAPHSLTKYMNPPKKVGNSPYFVFELEEISDTIGQSKSVVKTVFADSFIGKRIKRDLETNTATVINAEGISVKPLEGRDIELPYGGTYNVHFMDAQGQKQTAKGRTGEYQFLFKDESVSGATARLQNRIAEQTDRYEKIANSSNDGDAIADALREQSVGQ